MITLRKSADRGHANLGWLDSRHTFSFADYHDPAHMGFGPLRVLNEDHIAPGGGFGMHPHRDMEIITHMVSGSLEHRDSLGNSGVIRRGDIQRMTAGTGILHSEFNPSATDPAHLLQIWIRPDRRGLAPSYEQRSLADGAPEGGNLARGDVRLLASADGREGSVCINQRMDVHLITPRGAGALELPALTGRSGWLQVVSGRFLVGDVGAGQGDGVAFADEAELAIRAESEGEALLFTFAGD